MSFNNTSGYPLVVILGPTATGKTEVGVEMARRLGGEVISADSMQIYKYMNIGTAKPNLEERGGIPHHLIDVAEPDQDFSAALFQLSARQLVQDIVVRGKLPILVGGTGLYIRAVVDKYDFSSAGVDHEFRDRMWEAVEQHGKGWLHQFLASVDPESARRLHPNDAKRIIRALEVFKLTGQTSSSFNVPGGRRESLYRLVMFGLRMPREKLYRRIDDRVDKMMEQGLVIEVRQLIQRGYGRRLKSMQSLGYNEIGAYLAGEIDLAVAVELIKRNTRRFAKRQLTWFRQDRRIHWVDLDHFTSPAEVAREISETAAGVLAIASNN
ncbi:MAG: tRNA (adenosine(37)-N6)-dimethylallyltransferase MiaA [Bacillota bacterium]